MSAQTVLVSGATGFLGLHIVIQLLEQGYLVRGTLRSPERAKRKCAKVLRVM